MIEHRKRRNEKKSKLNLLQEEIRKRNTLFWNELLTFNGLFSLLRHWSIKLLTTLLLLLYDSSHSLLFCLIQLKKKEIVYKKIVPQKTHSRMKTSLSISHKNLNISIQNKKIFYKRNELKNFFIGYRNWICLCNCVFYDCIVETDNYNKAIDYEII